MSARQEVELRCLNLVLLVILTLFLPVLRPLGYGLWGGTCLACFGAHDRMNIKKKKKSLRMPLFYVEKAVCSLG